MKVNIPYMDPMGLEKASTKIEDQEVGFTSNHKRISKDILWRKDIVQFCLNMKNGGGVEWNFGNEERHCL